MRVYLDNAATTRISEKALLAMEEVMRESWGNASSGHGMGMAARVEVEKARNIIGALLNVDPARIVFTSGATEANNAALRFYAMEGKRVGQNHLVVSGIEHPSVLEYCKYLKRAHEFELSVVKPEDTGVVRLEDIEREIRPDTAFVAVMAVSNEVGSIQPFGAIHDLCRSRGVPYHCDATQAVGHIPFGVGMDDSSFSFSAHKFHGGKGVGALVLPAACSFRPMIIGGNQEYNRRAGTENASGIVSMAVSLSEQSCNNGFLNRISELKQYFWKNLQEQVEGVILNGTLAGTVPYILNVSFQGVRGDVLASMLSERYGVYCSTGSACCSGDTMPSRVLKEMGFSDERAMGSVRFSFSRYTTEEDVECAIRAVSKSVSSIRCVDL